MMKDVPNTVTQTETRTGGTGWSTSPSSSRVPGLTVLYHPDPERVGERTVLAGLGAGRLETLSRQAPDFAAPGAEACRPLADARLSRTPILLRPVDGGGVKIERGTSRTRLTVFDREVEEETTLPRGALEDGVVLLLGGRIVLLLHLLDPATGTSIQRFGLVGESPAMVRLRRDIVQTADLRVPILLRGESGTGKELVARAIHDTGPRGGEAYVAINMAAIPPSLAAAELFGAERGAYTGAQRRRAGHFERARGGTLFLDEIGETPPEVQVLLLRALETGEIQSVGGERPEAVDTRVISATDADLESAVAAERFRGPLLHRLSGYVIRLPPLRVRREDFGRLFVFFLRRELKALGLEDRLDPRSRPWIPAPLVARLASWHWPGNVRQLANVVRQLVIANRGDDPADRFEEVEEILTPSSPPPPPLPASHPPAPVSTSPEPRRPSDLREEDVIAALRAHRFRPTAAADALGIPRPSIYDLMAKIPSLRKVSDLTLEEIDDARARVGASVEAVAAELEVSERALRRRLRELGG